MDEFKSGPMRELSRRGLVKQCSATAGLDGLLASGARIAVYAGFDPTAGSLHAGHMATLKVLEVFARHGHEALPLLGTATALVGDPTGRTTARPLLTKEEVDSNAAGVEESIGRVMGTAPFRVLRNGDWLSGAGLLSFLRDVGAHVPMSRLLAQDSVKSRLGEGGISFLESCYPLMQAWDFQQIASGRPALLQVGGSDQWSNICMGLELISRSGGCASAFGLTHPLLVDSEGRKMGKTSGGGAAWINPGALDDFGWFRWWRTLPDADAPGVARMLSDIDPREISDAESCGGGALDALKERLAHGMTAAVRGRDQADGALTASRGRGVSTAGLSIVEVTAAEMADLPAVAVRAGLFESKSEVRRVASQGGLRVNGLQRNDPRFLDSDLDGSRTLVISRGRTRHAAVRFGLE